MHINGQTRISIFQYEESLGDLPAPNFRSISVAMNPTTPYSAFFVKFHHKTEQPRQNGSDPLLLNRCENVTFKIFIYPKIKLLNGD
jgi:hypothetical protein